MTAPRPSRARATRSRAFDVLVVASGVLVVGLWLVAGSCFAAAAASPGVCPDGATVVWIDGSAPAGGDGSQSAPHRSLAAAVVSARENACLVVVSSPREPDAATAPIRLGAGLQLLGVGTAIETPGVTVTVAEPPVIQCGLVVAGDGVVVAGIDVVRASGPGIVVDSANDVRIRDVAVRGAHEQGLQLDNIGHVELTRVTVTGCGGEGVRLDQRAVGAELEMRDCAVADNGGSGGVAVKVRGTATADVAMDESRIESNRGVGVGLGAEDAAVVYLHLHGGTVADRDGGGKQHVGVSVAAQATAVATIDVRDTTRLEGGRSHAVSLVAFDSATIKAAIEDNPTLGGSVAGSGVRAVAEGRGTAEVTIRGNGVAGFQWGHGVELRSRGDGSRLHAVLRDNRFRPTDDATRAEVMVTAGSPEPGHAASVCLEASGNRGASPSENPVLRLEGYRGSELVVDGWTGGPIADVTSYLEHHNPSMRVEVADDDGTFGAPMAGRCRADGREGER